MWLLDIVQLDFALWYICCLCILLMLLLKKTSLYDLYFLYLILSTWSLNLEDLCFYSRLHLNIFNFNSDIVNIECDISFNYTI